MARPELVGCQSGPSLDQQLKTTLNDSEIRSTPILEAAWRIVNKKEQSGITIPGEPCAILPSQPLYCPKTSEPRRFAGKFYSGLDTWYRFNFRSSVERSMLRICAA